LRGAITTPRAPGAPPAVSNVNRTASDSAWPAVVRVAALVLASVCSVTAVIVSAPGCSTVRTGRGLGAARHARAAPHRGTAVRRVGMPVRLASRGTPRDPKRTRESAQPRPISGPERATPITTRAAGLGTGTRKMFKESIGRICSGYVRMPMAGCGLDLALIAVLMGGGVTLRAFGESACGHLCMAA